ncbi:MAG TPA: methyltransferase domain-containing protein [Candidatus Acidoferrales bacterium]|nr:methyltransferase domain-containing protein [Candidatus Acidoferrales bacterium]
MKMQKRIGACALLAALGAAAAGGMRSLPWSLPPARAADYEAKQIVPFVPTPQEVVERMLALAQVKKGDVVYDLGSGDGRIVITAAKKYGAKAVGFEIDPELIKQSREAIRKEGLGHLAEIREQDILTVDLSPASVVTMYLLPSVNLQLRPKVMAQLKPGARVVSHAFDMGDWKPDKTEAVKDSSGYERTIYLWIIKDKRPS